MSVGTIVDAAFNYITQGWNNVPYTEEEFRGSAEALMASLDYTNMPPALMLLPAGLFAVDAPGGALGGNATLFRRSGTIQQAATPVPLQPGLFRLRPLAALYRLAPGFFLTADRDLPNTPLAQILDTARRLAEAELVPGARLADPPLRTAAVALDRFKTMLPDPGFELFFASGPGNAPDRYIQAFSDGAALCVPMGGPAAGAARLRSVLGSHLYLFRSSMPGLIEVFSPAVGPQAFEQGLTELARHCFRPPRDPPSCLADILAVEAVAEGRLLPLTTQNTNSTSAQKVQWLCDTVAAELRAGRGAPSGAGADAGAVSEITVPAGKLARLRAALADPLSKEVMVKVQALTAQPAVNPVLVSTELLKSDIMLVRKFAMGYKVGTEWPLYQSIFASAAHHVAKWDYVLSMRLVARADGTIPEPAQSFRLSMAVKADHPLAADYKDLGEKLRGMKLDRLPLLSLAYLTKGLRESKSYEELDPMMYWTRLEHYEAALELVGRIEAAMGHDPEAVNSLTVAVRRAKDFFNDHCSGEATRATSLCNINGNPAPGVNYAILAIAVFSPTLAANLIATISLATAPIPTAIL